MELATGTEPRDEFYAFEIMAAVNKILKDIMLVKPGENVVITTDTKSDFRLVVPTAQAAYAMGATPTIVWYQAMPHGAMDPPAPAGAALQKADVFIEYTSAYILYSDTQRLAREAGARYGSFGEMDVELIVDTVGKVNYPLMLKLGDKLVELSNTAKEVRITDPSGTDLVCEMRGSKAEQWGGLGDKPGAEVMLGGQTGWLPTEESEPTINGTLVFDGMVYPPAEVGVLRSPVTLKIEKGRIVEVTGNDAPAIKSYLAGFNDPNMYRVAHYTYGFNPGVTKPSGRVNTDERVFGSSCHGFGSRFDRKAAGHFDGVTLKPSFYLDGKAIEIEGKYVHPELVAICKEMGIPGY